MIAFRIELYDFKIGTCLKFWNFSYMLYIEENRTIANEIRFPVSKFFCFLIRCQKCLFLSQLLLLELLLLAFPTSAIKPTKTIHITKKALK